MYQYVRCAENKDNERIWRVHGIEDSGSRGEFQFQEVEIGEFYLQICPLLYTGSLLWSTGTGDCATTRSYRHGDSGRMG